MITEVLYGTKTVAIIHNESHAKEFRQKHFKYFGTATVKRENYADEYINWRTSSKRELMELLDHLGIYKEWTEITIES